MSRLREEAAVEADTSDLKLGLRVLQRSLIWEGLGETTFLRVAELLSPTPRTACAVTHTGR